MPSKEPKDLLKRRSISITDDDWNELVATAAASGMSVTSLMRMVIRSFLTEKKRKRKILDVKIK